jgi:allophanate hydrolase
MRTVAGFDSNDSLSRPEARTVSLDVEPPPVFRFGIPRAEDQCFFGDHDTPHLFAQATRDLEQLGGIAVEVDFTPFRQAGELLYQGPWIAERLAQLKDFFARNAEAVLPVTRDIIQDGARYSAVDAFLASYKLADLKRQTEPVWEKIDALIVPTAGTIYTIADVQANPLALNTNLGHYTNFVNLLDCCAVATPHSFTSSGLPFGITLIAPAWRDGLILALAERLQRSLGLCLGATGSIAPAGQSPPGFVCTVVVGAHLRGQPLNVQLLELGARFVRQSRTAPCYRFFALEGSPIPRAGLVRVVEGGAAIEVEVWELSLEAFGHLVQLTSPPLAMGSVVLDSGETLNGFVCEPVGMVGANEITSYGSWRRFRREGGQ